MEDQEGSWEGAGEVEGFWGLGGTGDCFGGGFGIADVFGVEVGLGGIPPGFGIVFSLFLMVKTGTDNYSSQSSPCTLTGSYESLVFLK